MGSVTVEQPVVASACSTPVSPAGWLSSAPDIFGSGTPPVDELTCQFPEIGLIGVLSYVTPSSAQPANDSIKSKVEAESRKR
jgi:hypothetical protein